MDDERKYEILLDLLALKEVFQSVGIRFFMQEGNALGYGRFKDIMPWDTDIDIGVACEVSQKKRTKLFKALVGNGWMQLIDSGDFIFARRIVKLNIWFYHKVNYYYKDGEFSFYEARPESTPGQKFVWPAKFYDNLQKVKLQGEIFYVPNHLEEYLAFRYGEDWKTNIQKDDVIWKQSEPFCFKWVHKMEETANPLEMNIGWIKHIGINITS